MLFYCLYYAALTWSICVQTLAFFGQVLMQAVAGDILLTFLFPLSSFNEIKHFLFIQKYLKGLYDLGKWWHTWLDEQINLLFLNCCHFLLFSCCCCILLLCCRFTLFVMLCRLGSVLVLHCICCCLLVLQCSLFPCLLCLLLGLPCALCVLPCALYVLQFSFLLLFPFFSLSIP